MWIMILEERGPDNRAPAQSGQTGDGGGQFPLIPFNV